MGTRNPRAVVRGLATVWLLQSAASGAMLPFVVVWAHRVAGLAGAAAGVLFVVQAVGEFSAGLAGGRLADRFGHRRLLLLATLGMALGYGLLAVGSAPGVAIALFLVAGLFESAFHPNVFALVGDTVDDAELTRSFGVLRIGANVGSVVGPLLGAAAALASLSAVFAVAGGLLVLAVLAEIVVVPRDVASLPDEDDEPELPPGTFTALRRDRRLLVLVLAGGLLAVAFTWFEADGLVLLRRQHPLSTTGYAALFTIAAVVSVALQLPITRITRNAHVGRTLLAGVAVQAVGLATLAFAGAGYPVLVVAAVLLALGQLVYGPTLQTFVSRRAGASRQASYQAALSITEDVGTAVGPASGLGLGGAFGAVTVWIVGAVVCVVAGLGSSLAAGRREPAATGRTPAEAQPA